MKTPEKKEIFYTKNEIFSKIRFQLTNADTVFGRKNEKGSLVSELNPKL